MEERWQVEMKDIRESCASLFGKELFADVFFLVGKDKEKQRIPAHKIFLSCMSPVFEKLFYGSLASQSNEIEVTDIDPDGFLVFLRYIYSGKNDVNADTVMSTLYAAKKYDVPILEGLCEQYLIASVQSENAFMLLGQALHFEEAKLQSRCCDIIDWNPHAALSSDGFLDAAIDCLCLVLERDSLGIPENDLYQKCPLTLFELLNLNKFTSCRPYFKSLKIYTVTNLYAFRILRYAKRLYDKGMMVCKGERHGHLTRAGTKVTSVYRRTKRFSDSPCLMAVSLFNLLPEAIRKANVKTYGGWTRDHFTNHVYYQAVLRWGEAQCKKQTLEPTPTNQRSVLGKAFDLIRFPLMTSKQFALGPVASGLLTAEETIDIFNYLCAGKGKVEQYVNRPRYDFVFIRRFQNVFLHSAPQGDSFNFHVNRNVRLVALEFFGCVQSPCLQHQVSVNIKRAGGFCGEINVRAMCDTFSRTYRVYFEPPIHLEKFDGNHNYFLTAQVTGPSVCRVGKVVQQPGTKFGDFTFTFVERDNYYGAVGKTEGQIARIILSESFSAKELRNAPQLTVKKNI